MTKKLEDVLNLSPMPDFNCEEKALPVVPDDEEESSDLDLLVGLKDKQHNVETAHILKRAMETFEEIVEVGKNSPPDRSARIFEVAGQFLKTGLDATNSRIDAQIKASKIKIEAAKLKVGEEAAGHIRDGKRVLADRNELLKQLIEESKKNTIDVDPRDSSAD